MILNFSSFRALPVREPRRRAFLDTRFPFVDVCFLPKDPCPCLIFFRFFSIASPAAFYSQTFFTFFNPNSFPFVKARSANIVFLLGLDWTVFAIILNNFDFLLYTIGFIFLSHKSFTLQLSDPFVYCGLTNIILSFS